MPSSLILYRRNKGTIIPLWGSWMETPNLAGWGTWHCPTLAHSCPLVAIFRHMQAVARAKTKCENCKAKAMRCLPCNAHWLFNCSFSCLLRAFFSLLLVTIVRNERYRKFQESSNYPRKMIVHLFSFLFFLLLYFKKICGEYLWFCDINMSFFLSCGKIHHNIEFTILTIFKSIVQWY